MANDQGAKKSVVAFDPPSGGDISLRSKDGSVFCVHSVILGLVSSVFSDMFSIGKSSGEVIELDDDSESISLMLAFIYPSGIWPTIKSIDILEKCLEIARKYNIEKIPQALDRDLALSEANTGLIRYYEDPLRVFRLAVTFGLRKCQTLAAKAITPNHIDLRKPAEIVKVAQEHSNMAHVIGLVSVQTMRIKILTDVLFNFEGDFLPTTYAVVNPAGKHPKYTDADGGGLMMCDQCASQFPNLWLTKVRPISYIPSWIYGWSRMLYKQLSSRPLDQLEYFFELSILNTWITDELGVCEDCVEAAKDACVELGGRPGEAFECWASNAQRILVQELGQLDALYSL